MDLFSKYVKSGDTIIEVGGHIGFVTQYLSRLVGPTGRVIVFEPGSNNRRYIERNVRDLKNVVLEPIAIADFDGEASFYEDNVSGQNNCLSESCKTAETVAKSHGVKLVRRQVIVKTTRLDTYIAQNRLLPVAFIKIDIEGVELSALKGLGMLGESVPALMVELSDNQAEVEDLLRGFGYRLLDENGETINDIPAGFFGNVFAQKG